MASADSDDEDGDCDDCDDDCDDCDDDCDDCDDDEAGSEDTPDEDAAEEVDSDGSVFAAPEGPVVLAAEESLAGAGANAGVGAGTDDEDADDEDADDEGAGDALVGAGVDVVGLFVVDVTGGGVLDDGASRVAGGATSVEAVVGATASGARVWVGASTTGAGESAVC